MFAQHLTNTTTTINGAVSQKSSLNAVLDLFSMGISSTPSTQLTLVAKAFNENPLLTLKCILYLRDVRQGQGNRDLFRLAMNMLIKENLSILKEILPHIPEIGRWKDVYELYGKNKLLNNTILSLVHDSLVHKRDSLCAKWFPRQSQFHKDYAEFSGMSIGQARRFVTQLTKVVETQMCNRQWHEINYEHVPSIANIKYSKAFIKNDSSRRQDFLDKVLAGKATAKASVSYPHDIVNMIGFHWYTDKTQIKSANALWSQLPDYMPKDNQFNVLPIIDTSGSMLSPAKGTTASCLSIAAGLGIYMAERNTGSYKNLWVNFSTSPRAYYLSGSTLLEKLKSLDYSNWSGSTNLDAVMQMVLNSAKECPEDAPKVILIVSDMEFNYCGRYTNYNKFKQDFQALGLELPTIVFWRVNVLSEQQPATMLDKKVMLINGYSPTVLKEILNGNILDYTPEKAMKAILEPKYAFLDGLFQ